MNRDVLISPFGLSCLATAFAAGAEAVVAGAILTLVLAASPAAAQDMTREDAQAEAEALAAGLEGDVQAGATQTVDAGSVPSFVTDAPPETAHYGSPAGLESAGLSQTFTNNASVFVHDSMGARPIVTADELATWTANGLGIEANATDIVTEYGGAYGDCTTEITPGSGGTTYSYACNEGETLLEYVASCPVTLDVSFETEFVYQCEEWWLRGDCSFEPNPFCATIAAHADCGPLAPVAGPFCGPDGGVCGVDCSDIVLEATCATPIPGHAAHREIPGPAIDAWNASACDAHAGDAHCTFLGETCVEGSETRVIDGVPVTRDCWAFERSYQCSALGGVVDDCDIPPECVLAGSTCLSTDDATGDCRTWEHEYVCTAEGTPGGAVGYCEEDVYCIAGDCETLTRPQNDEFPQAISALSLLGELEDDVDQTTLEVFPGEYAKCDKAIAGLQNCCSNDGLLTTIGFGCSPDDQALAQQQAAGLCHYVGTYCSNKTLFGICVKKRKTFCCFNNTLARIIHEQGRPQVGIGWGDVRDPDCSGYTVALFQQLDLSVMDFSEFYDEVLDGFAAPDADAAGAAITQKIIDAYACPPNC